MFASQARSPVHGILNHAAVTMPETRNDERRHSFYSNRISILSSPASSLIVELLLNIRSYHGTIPNDTDP